MTSKEKTSLYSKLKIFPFPILPLKPLSNTKSFGTLKITVTPLGETAKNFFVSLIVSAYILLERTEIIKFARILLGAIFEKDACKKIGMYFNRTNEIFLKFLASQLLDAIVVGVLTTIAMSLLRVRYAVLLGIIIGLFNMIPYFLPSLATLSKIL